MLEIVFKKKFLKFLIFFLNLTLLLIAQSQMWQRDRLDSMCLMEEFLFDIFHPIPNWAIVEPADKDQ